MNQIDAYEILKDYSGEFGWRVLPVNKQTKAPLIKEWTKNATNNLETIKTWTSTSFKYCNWGVATGKGSGIIVLDLDRAKGDKASGEESLNMLENELGKLPHTVESRTPSGGRHLFFNYPVNSNISGGISVADGLDVMSDGRQVLVSPSKRDENYYEWVVSPWDYKLADLPSAWIKHLEEAHGNGNKKSQSNDGSKIKIAKTEKFELPEVIEEGGRNDLFFKYASSLLGKGCDPEFILSDLIEQNISRCPHPLDTSELEIILASAVKTHGEHRIEKIEKITSGAVKEDVPWLMIDEKDRITIDEPKYAEWFMKKHQLTVTNGLVYSAVKFDYINDDAIENMINTDILPYVKTGLANKVTSIMKTFKRMAYKEQPKLDKFVVRTRKQSFRISSDGMTEIAHELVPNAFPIDWNPEATCPKWDAYIKGLIPAHAIRTLQQYLGYLLIPTNASQKTMFLIGAGGEGKSVILDVMREILGDYNTKTGNLQKLFKNNFLTSQLQSKYVFFGDDLDSESLDDTGDFKTWVTAKKVTVERKGVDAYEIEPYTRFLCCGNNMLSAKFDRTDGFFRRLIIINVLPKPAHRRDNLFFTDELLAEAEGIFNWCVQGLIDLAQNGFIIYESEETKTILNEERKQQDALEMFLEDSGMLTVEPGEKEYQSFSDELLFAYNQWAIGNGYHDYKTVNKFIRDIKPKLIKRGCYENKNIKKATRSGRGFSGVLVHTEKINKIQSKIIQMK